MFAARAGHRVKAFSAQVLVNWGGFPPACDLECGEASLVWNRFESESEGSRIASSGLEGTS